MFRFKIMISLSIVFFVLLNTSAEENNVLGKKVCIIFEKTDYKNAAADKLEKELNGKNITVIKDLLFNINKYNPDDYNAVIILSGVKIFTPNPLATAYIKKHNYKKNIIYVCTTKYRKEAYGFLDQDKIDAITSASRKINIDEILEKLFIILNQQ